MICMDATIIVICMDAKISMLMIICGVSYRFISTHLVEYSHLCEDDQDQEK